MERGVISWGQKFVWRRGRGDVFCTCELRPACSCYAIELFHPGFERPGSNGAEQKLAHEAGWYYTTCRA